MAKSGYAEGLLALVDRTVSVITNDGRNLVGLLRGVDPLTNLVLASCQERIFTEEAGCATADLGLYLVRGDNVAVVGELDEAQHAQLDLSDVKAPPLKPVVL
ncbi:unnamed protein product [Pedinophyceae sp. YPF-701]|nr:unnamed protein product [Pedinophyceae sp. YPF-701]